jgi:hypothetical protein
MKLIVFTTAVVLLTALSTRAKDWRGIVPLHSTRADVERLLGPPETDRGSAIFYTVDFSSVSFDFPQAPCGKPGSLWNVASNIVTGIWVTHQQLHEVRLGDVNLSSGFRTQKDLELDYIVYYINDAEGISYEVDNRYGTDANGAIVALTKYFAPAKENNLRCPVKG